MGRFALSVVAAYVAFAVLFTVAMMVVYPDTMALFADLMRGEDDPMMMWAYAGHLVQTVVLVWLFDRGFATNDLKKGAMFGGAFGLYVAATTFTMYMSFKWPVGGHMHVQMITDVAIFVIVGVILALLYKPKAA